MSVIIYHNPRCSKSRATLDILQSENTDLKIVKYLETPPTEEELKNILTMLKLTPQDLMRKNEAEYKQAGLDQANLSVDEQIKRMIQYPKVIERPIVVNNNKAIIGRPPGNVKSIL